MNIGSMTASELRSQIFFEGEVRSAQLGNQITLHYTGTLFETGLWSYK